MEENGSGVREQQRVESEDTNVNDYRLTRDRVRRVIRPPSRYGEADLVAYALATTDEFAEMEPSNYTEAVNCKESYKWKQAMEEEMTSLLKNQTWELVTKPKNKRLVTCKWLYKVKPGINNNSELRFKARLVARGYTQREGEDYNEIFSPVVRHSSIRVILALTTHFNLHLDQMDVKTAFLQGELEEEIYMNQPQGFERKGEEEKVCLLKKSLYGLKQSPRQWYKRFDSFMLTKGFARSLFDQCVYYKIVNLTDKLYLLQYVDDMLIACINRGEIEKVKAELSSEFDMKDLGEAKKILGIEISRDMKENRLFLSQRSYISKLLSRFSMVLNQFQFP